MCELIISLKGGHAMTQRRWEGHVRVFGGRKREMTDILIIRNLKILKENILVQCF